MADLWWLSCGVCGCDSLVCVECGRVRRYCSEICAGEALEEARRRARRKHQASAEGRLDHRDRQREYRARRRSRVMDNSARDLSPGRSLCRDNAPLNYGHDPGDPDDYAPARSAGLGRDDDREARSADMGAPTRAVDDARSACPLVPDTAPRCALCGKRGGRVVDRPRRWPWARRIHAPLPRRQAGRATASRKAAARHSRHVHRPP